MIDLKNYTKIVIDESLLDDIDDVIAAGDTVSDVKVTLSYNFASDDTLLNQDVNLSDLNARINFVQSTN